MSAIEDGQRFFGVTGRPGTGKTTLLERIARHAATAGIRCGGFLQLRGTKQGERVSEYLLTHTTDFSSITIARYDGNHGYVYNESAFAKARRWLHEDAHCAQLLIVDELGVLEADGRGHAPALDSLLEHHVEAVVLAGLRKQALQTFVDRYSIRRDRLIDLDTDTARTDVFINVLFAELRLISVQPIRE